VLQKPHLNSFFGNSNSTLKIRGVKLMVTKLCYLKIEFSAAVDT